MDKQLNNTFGDMNLRDKIIKTTPPQDQSNHFFSVK